MIPTTIIVGYILLLNKFAWSELFTFLVTLAYPPLSLQSRKVILGNVLPVNREDIVLRKCPPQEIEDALSDIAAAAQALFGALSLYKNEP